MTLLSVVAGWRTFESIFFRTIATPTK